MVLPNELWLKISQYIPTCCERRVFIRAFNLQFKQCRHKTATWMNTSIKSKSSLIASTYWDSENIYGFGGEFQFSDKTKIWIGKSVLYAYSSYTVWEFESRFYSYSNYWDESGNFTFGTHYFDNDRRTFLFHTNAIGNWHDSQTLPAEYITAMTEAAFDKSDTKEMPSLILTKIAA